MRPLFGLFFALAGCCAIAACSGSVGGGSSLPGGQLPPLQNPATPAVQASPTPSIVTGNVVVGDGSPLSIPAPGDFKVTAVFPKSTASPVTLKATVSVTGPGGISAYGDQGAAKKRLFVRHHTQSPAILYVWFESDKGVTISSTPSLVFTVPLSALEPFGTDPIIDLALYDPAVESRWMQKVAMLVRGTPAPSGTVARVAANATETATATPSPTPSPTPTATPTATPVSTPRPPGAPPAPSLTPAALAQTPRAPVRTTEFRFEINPRTMKLLPHKDYVFVLYAEPAATETPSAAPTSSKSSKGSKPPQEGSASPAASAPATASASPSGSPSPAGSASASASAVPSPQGSKGS